MATNLVYDPAQQKWVPSSSESVGSVAPATPASSPNENKPASASGNATQVNAAGQANKAQAELEYNTLEGDLVLRAKVGVLKITQDTTIELAGVGNYLSGLYYVSAVRYSLDASSGFTMSCTLIKTGFGSSLKAKPATPVPAVRKEVVKKTATAIAVKDRVRIVGKDAVYSNASAGVKVPNWVKQKTLTVQQISKDGTRALVQPINSWTYLKYLEKV